MTTIKQTTFAWTVIVNGKTVCICHTKQTTFAWTVIVNGKTVCICHTKEQAEKIAAKQ